MLLGRPGTVDENLPSELIKKDLHWQNLLRYCGRFKMNLIHVFKKVVESQIQ